MSFQKHFKRSEIWLVSEGSCIVNYSKGSSENKNIQLNKFDHYLVPVVTGIKLQIHSMKLVNH